VKEIKISTAERVLFYAKLIDGEFNSILASELGLSIANTHRISAL